MGFDASGPVVVFPGQGAHHSGMREVVARIRPDLLVLVETIIGDDPFERLADGTRYVQPAVYLTSVCSWLEVADDLRPRAFAGHSLGEIAALASAGALSFEDGLRVATERGRLTARAAASIPGGMIAVLGITLDEARTLADSAGVAIANDNAPAQIVLSGPDPALKQARRVARAAGLRVIRLDIDGAFHSPAMARVTSEYEAFIRRLPLSETGAPVYCGSTTEAFNDIPSRLAQSLTDTVRWRELIGRLMISGADCFVEAAPGETLSRLIRRIAPGASAEPLDVLRAGGA